MKRVFILVMVFIMVISAFIIGRFTKENINHEAEETSISFYEDLTEDLELFKVYESNELTAEMLENRNGKLIIEKCYGVVLDEDGNGEILNKSEDTGCYISYRRVKDAKPGNIILTYFIYNTENNYIDDIVYRCDYIIDYNTI